MRRLVVILVLAAASCLKAVDVNRAMILTPPTGAAAGDHEILRWQQKIAAPDATVAEYERLGWAFVAAARRTLDAGYYRMAETTATVMDAQFGRTPEARLLRGHACHNLHRFAEAADLACQLVKERGLPEDWALLSDALMEQGDLAGAVDALQHLANVKPGAEADTRIAHLRWLKGDLPGAVAAMSAAVRETSPDEHVALAWMLARLSGYVLQAGELARADVLADAGLKQVADYAPALLAKARVKLAKHDAALAVDLLVRAEKANPLPEYQWWLLEACEAAGDATRAQSVRAKLTTQGAVTDPRTYALFLATEGRSTPQAVKLARAELGIRHDVLTHDALAWALFSAGDVPAAHAEIEAGLAEHTQDARLFLHAAAIAEAMGRRGEAQTFATKANAARATLLPSEEARLAAITRAIEPATMAAR